jgi:hypothetical protein
MNTQVLLSAPEEATAISPARPLGPVPVRAMHARVVIHPGCERVGPLPNSALYRDGKAATGRAAVLA